MKWKNKGHELDYIKDIILDKDTSYYIWGAGVYGEVFCREHENDIEILGFIDSNESKQGTRLEGKTIYSPDILFDNKENIKVIIATGWTAQVSAELERMSYQKNLDFFYHNIFTLIYHFYKSNRLEVASINYRITDRCTLRCRECFSFIPYIKNARHVPTTQIMLDLEKLFQTVDFLNIMVLTGGDAMMHNDFDKLLEQIGEKYYRSHIANIEVFTNAIIIPKESTLQLFKKYNVIVRFTDYGENAKNKQRIPEMKSVLESKRVSYDHAVFDSWCKSGYLQGLNGITGDENLMKFFDKCDKMNCATIFEGKVIMCSTAFAADRVDYHKMQEGDFFSLDESDKINKAELLEYLLGYSQHGYVSFCTKCTGSFNVNMEKIPLGEQL